MGNNTPVFFIRDPLKFPDFIHTQKRHPQSNLKNAQMMWDFWSHSPEALHQVTILFSDRGIPDGYRHMHGFGSHTYSLISASGERTWVKWHFKTQQGIKNLAPADAARLAGTDPDYAQRDLFEAIERGDYPRWTVCIQVMSEAEAASRDENPFDVTKTWPQKDYPLIEVGVLELNRGPLNYFAEVGAGCVRAEQHGARGWPVAGPHAAGPCIRLRRRTPLPCGHQPPAFAGECATLRSQQLPARRLHGHWQLRQCTELRAQQLR